MKIHYDWRLARVIDQVGNILDEVVWDGRRTASSVANRLSMTQNGRILPEVRDLMDRFPDAILDHLGSISDPDWPPSDDDEDRLVNEASNFLARKGVADAAENPDRRLDMLVSATIELRSAWTTSEARCVEWSGLFISEADLDLQRDEIPKAVSEASDISGAAQLLGVSDPSQKPSDAEWKALQNHAHLVVSLTRSLDEHEEAIREIAESHIPSLSALMGPLGSAKLVVLAGGRERLARMPSGSLQVLGAQAAMSAHRRGAPPPKHGAVLFSMPQVSRSPRWVRGKIARFIAGKASIAARVDHFGGKAWGKAEIDQINNEVEAIKAKFPRPPKRR